MVKVLCKDMINEVLDFMDPHILKYIEDGRTETFENLENFDLVAFDWYDIYNPEAPAINIKIYLDKEDLFFICEDENTCFKVSLLINEEEDREHILHAFFSALIKDDSAYLDDLESKASEIEDSIISNSSRDSAEILISLRHRILKIRKFYEQLDSAFEGLCENNNNLIGENGIRYFVILGRRIDKLIFTVQNLSEYISEVREAYQSQIDIEQNNIMRYFTVITSIFLPLTLITGWYGMNFDIPELAWKYGYLMVVILSVIIFVVCLILVKKKKWF